MKKLILLAFGLVLLSFGVKAQEVSKKNWTLIHEKTADWCPFCGTWGWKMKDSILTKFANDNVIFMAVHYSGGLANSTTTEFDSNFGGLSQPVFFVDGTDIDVSSSNINQKLEETSWELDFKSTASVIAGVGINARMSETEDSLWVDARVEFLEGVTGGEYYFSLYTLEDVNHTQASLPGTPLHKQVLRKSLGPVFGKKFHSGALAAGTEFTFSEKLGLVTTDRKKLKVAGIIWTKVDNKYRFFNGNLVSPAIPAATEDSQLEPGALFAYQNEGGQVVVRLPETVTDGDVTLMVSDISGKVLGTKNVKASETKNPVTIDGNFGSGIHIVTAVSGNKKQSSKVVLY